MFTYKVVKVKHSVWTGKPESKIENIIEDHAAEGWRFVQVLQDHAAMWYKGRIFSKVIFEKKVAPDFYDNPSYQSETYSEESFV